ncbi:hypothetical protein G7054_g11436 [Neopestalotiopsis clavispora]|nr:hypothetical protein G7054_g11436 [Neopestalotiopsis clavispora]
MRSMVLFVTAVLLFCSLAASNSVIVESLPTVPDGWQIVEKANASSIVQLRIALESPHVSSGLFERTLLEISTPSHPSYRHFLSREQVRELVKPRQESTDAVLAWLESAGIPAQNIENTGDWINFRATISEVESLLNANFNVYSHGNSSSFRTRTLAYSVPEAIRSHITTIQPTTVFSGMQKPTTSLATHEKVHDVEGLSSTLDLSVLDTNKTEALKVCNYFIVPNCLRLLYNIGNYTAKPAAKTIFGISGFLEQYANYASLETFLGKYAALSSDQNFTTTLVNSGQNYQDGTDDTEASLDIQYAAALGFNTDLRFYSVGGRGPLVPDLE